MKQVLKRFMLFCSIEIFKTKTYSMFNMTSNLLVQMVPKCLDDGNYLESQVFSIKPVNKKTNLSEIALFFIIAKNVMLI